MNSKNIFNEINYIELLGQNIKDEIINSLLNCGPNYKVKVIKNYTYINFHDQGVSLSFIDEILQNVYFYNEGIQGFKQYKGIIPYNINWSMKNKNIVEFFGDTNKKGGGSAPIWLSYERLGIEVTFLGMIWNDLENPLVHICLFDKDKSNKDCSVCLKKITNRLDCSNNCDVVQYCSKECKNAHINFHLKFCNKN